MSAGFVMLLKQYRQEWKEFGPRIGTTIKKEKNTNLSFAVGLRQTDITKSVVDPELIKFSVEAVINDSVLFIKSEVKDTLKYSYIVAEINIHNHSLIIRQNYEIIQVFPYDITAINW